MLRRVHARIHCIVSTNKAELYQPRVRMRQYRWVLSSDLLPHYTPTKRVDLTRFSKGVWMRRVDICHVMPICHVVY